MIILLKSSVEST